MNFYNIKYSPEKKDNNIQRIIYNKKIKIYGFRKLKNIVNDLNLNNDSYKQEYKNR
jgi:hypothetical protein